MRGVYAWAIASNLLVEIGETEEAAGTVPAPGSSGSRILKRVFYRLAFTALSCHQRSREYYLRKRAEGKGGEQSVIAPARRRAKMGWAMLRDGRPYEDREPVAARREDRDAPS